MAEYEGNFILVMGILFFVNAFFYVLFFRISVMYIERELKKENGSFEILEVDKSFGARGVMYNQLILFKIKNHPYVDSEAVIRIARRKDWWLAFLSFYSLVLFVIVMAISYYLYAPADF